MRCGTTYSVSETDALAHRLELGTEPAHDLNCDVMRWLETSAGYTMEEMLTRFPSGFVFDVAAVEAVVEDLLPGARWMTGTLVDAAYRRGAGIFITGCDKPFVCEGPTSAHALLAAMLRAFSAARVVQVLRRAAA